MQKRLQQKKYFDKSARPLPSLQTGDKVRVQTPVGHARLGVVRRPPTPEQPRSYIVTVNGKDYRRNRRNLLKVTEVKKDSATRSRPETVWRSCKPVASAKSGDESTQYVVTRSGRLSKPVQKYQA